MVYSSKICLFSLVLLISACTKNHSDRPVSPSNANDLWLVPPENVLYKDMPKDRIKSIDKPEFIPINESSIQPDELVLVARIGDKTRIYPVSIMDAHEIVNDSSNDFYFSITYCPLTASGILWNRKIDGTPTEFGVSGMLYNENLMPYDRNTESIWSQMGSKCVHGSLMGKTPETKDLLETKFSTAARAFPGALVLNHVCGSGSCGGEGLLKNDPIVGETVDLPIDEDYFGFIRNENLLLFNLLFFSEGTQLYASNFQGVPLLVCGNKDLHFYTAFLNSGISRNYSFSPVQNEFPIVMEDNHGNRYTVFGEIVAGPLKGEYLEIATTYTARTFAWELFFGKIELFDAN